MANRDLRKIDFCKSRSRIQIGVDLVAPLDAVGLLGLTSLGCEPLIVHLRDAAGIVVSRVNQQSGTQTAQLLDSISNAGFIVGSPTQQDLLPSPTVAGLLGAPLPVTAGSVQVLPTTALASTLTWSIGSHPFIKAQDGQAVDLSSDPSSFGTSTFGFGGGSSGGGIVYVEFPANSGQEWTANRNLRANRQYVPISSLPFVPSLQPLMITFVSPTGYKVPFLSFGGDPLYSYQVSPCLVTCNGSKPPLTPAEVVSNGPSLTRERSHYRSPKFTTPGLGSSTTQAIDLSKSFFRAFLCIYADSRRVTSVTVSGHGLLSINGVASPAVPALPGSAITPPTGGWIFDTLYQFDIVGNEASYAVTITGPSGSASPTIVPWSSSQGAHVRCFEMFAILSA